MTTMEAERAASPRRATRALGRVETLRMLRHPVTVVATLLLIASWAATWSLIGARHYPVLSELDRESAIGVLVLLGGAALIVGNLAVLRAHRDGTTGLSQVLLLPEHARTAAHLAAVLPVAGLGAVLVVARMAVLGLAPAAGRPNPWELAAGPVGVLLLGALGVLLGRLTRSAVAAPLALLVLLASLVVLLPLAGGGKAVWLSPQGGPELSMPVPVSLMGRPAAAHLAYLLGLAALLAVAAVLRAGARAVVAGVLALACAVVGGVAQFAAPSNAVVAARTDAELHPSRYEICRTLDRVSYCALDGFGRWVPGWNTVVQSILAQVPADVRATPLTVRQRFAFAGLADRGHSDRQGPQRLLDAWQADDPEAIGVATRWGDHDSADGLAGQVAYRLVTGRTAAAHLEQGAELAGARACGGVGVLVVWLVGRRDRSGAVSFDENELIPGVSVPAAEVGVAMAALDQPHADVAARVQQNWATLAAPGTNATRAAQLLGVPAPATDSSC